MHRAVCLFKEFPCQLLFPKALESKPTVLEQLTLINRQISTNIEQARAVQHIIEMSPRTPYIIFGPPGTGTFVLMYISLHQGKTVTVVEAINQIFRVYRQSRILVCAPSNSAADLLLVRLAGKFMATQTLTFIESINQSDMIRINGFQRDPSPDLVPKKVLEYSFMTDRRFDLPTKDFIEKKRVVVSTCITASQLYSIGVANGFFTHLFVDEAGQSTEPETLTAMAGLVNEYVDRIVDAKLIFHPETLM